MHLIFQYFQCNCNFGKNYDRVTASAGYIAILKGLVVFFLADGIFKQSNTFIGSKIYSRVLPE